MADAAPSEMTVDDFLVWAEGRPARYELDGGTVIAMSPENVGHLRAKTNAYEALATAIRRAGLACEALPDGATVHIDVRTAYEPDALVCCGSRLPRRASEVPDPVIVVDVLSPSTGRHDRSGKLVGYFAVPSLHHYLIVDAERRVLVHHARRGDEIATRILRSGELRLDPPGLALEVADLFGEPHEDERLRAVAMTTETLSSTPRSARRRGAEATMHPSGLSRLMSASYFRNTRGERGAPL